MTKETNTTIHIMGKDYQLKCLPNEIPALQSAAVYLEKKINEVRNSGKVLSMDRIAILVALNLSHQYLNLENTIQNRLQNLYNKLEVKSSAE